MLASRATLPQKQRQQPKEIRKQKREEAEEMREGERVDHLGEREMVRAGWKMQLRFWKMGQASLEKEWVLPGDRF